MNGIFISYRRDDASGYAGRLYDRLAGHFGTDRVFMDVEGIEPGTDFVEAIDRAIGSCEILIVIIGKEWLLPDSKGRRRLDDPADFVRVETVMALSRGIRVVPVLVEGAEMPRAEELPTELVPLVRRQAVELSHKQWDATSAELIQTLERILDRAKSGAAAPVVSAAKQKSDAGKSAARVDEPEAVVRPPQPAITDGPPVRLYWGIGATMVLILAAGALVYFGQTWRSNNKPVPSPPVLFVTPGRLDFVDQPLHAAGTVSEVTLQNHGGSALHVTSVKLDGAQAADFALSDDQCTRREVAPAASCSIKVRFNPQTAGVRTATLVIAYDEAKGPVVVGMQGHGAESVVAQVPPPQVAPNPTPTPTPTPATTPPTATPAPTPTPTPTPVTPPKPLPIPKPETTAAPPKILQFESRVVGDTVQLCYGVENAATASIAPAPGVVRTSPKECVAIRGKLSNTYTLSARNDAGAAVTRTIEVDVPATAPPTQLVTVPNAIGKSRRDAFAALASAGLDAQVIDEPPDVKMSSSSATVVAQSPAGGERVKPGERVTLRVATASPPAAATPSSLPRVGDSWQYSYRSMWKNVEPQTYVHQVTAVSDREVRETMSFVAGGNRISDSKSFDADSRLVEWKGQGYYFVEFNPFLQAFGALQPGTTWKPLVTPIENPFFPSWYSQGRVVGWESVSVPAGSFKALRVEVNSNRNASASAISEPARVRYVLWYAPDAKRTVKHVRTVFTTSGDKIAEDTYDLVKYALK